MTKKEVALVKKVIAELLENTDMSVLDTDISSRELNIMVAAKADALIWLLAKTGNADDLPSEWHAEEFNG